MSKRDADLLLDIREAIRKIVCYLFLFTGGDAVRVISAPLARQRNPSL